MNRCYYCRKKFNEIDTVKEKQQHYHDRCIKKFFGMDEIPSLELVDYISMLESNISLPGVQPKLSFGISRKYNKITLINGDNNYILKPQSRDYCLLPENEYLVMSMANEVGIETVEFSILESKNNEKIYITKRIDRKKEGKNNISLSMEDFAQLNRKLESEKYNGSYEAVAKTIDKYSSYPILDKNIFLKIIIFSFVVGNSDMHLKNFSLIENIPYSNVYRLAPAYDLLSSKIVLPSDDEDLALTLNGKKKNITKNDFKKFCSTIGIDLKQFNDFVKLLVSKKEILLEMINNSFLTSDLKERLKTIFINNLKRLIL